MLNTHNDADVVACLVGEAVHPVGCTAGVYGILDCAASAVIGGESHSIVSTVTAIIACHQFSGTVQCRVWVPGIDAQSCGGTWQELGNTDGTGGRDGVGIKATFQVNLPCKIVRRNTGVDGILLCDCDVGTLWQNYRRRWRQ